MSTQPRLTLQSLLALCALATASASFATSALAASKPLAKRTSRKGTVATAPRVTPTADPADSANETAAQAPAATSATVPSDPNFPSDYRSSSDRTGKDEVWAGVGFIPRPVVLMGFGRNMTDRLTPEAELDWGYENDEDTFSGLSSKYKSERLHLAARLRFYPRANGSFSLTAGLAHDWMIESWERSDGSRSVYHFHNLESEFLIGNRWSLGDDMIIGADWVGVGFHLANLHRDDDSALENGASYVRSVLPSFHFLKFNVGYRF